MKIKRVPFALVAVALLSAMPSVHAQAVGLRVGIARPNPPQVAPINPPIQGFVTPPIQGFVTPPITAFGVPPIAPAPPSTFFQPAPAHFPQRHFDNARHNRNTMITPGATVFVPGPFFADPIVTNAIPPAQPIDAVHQMPPAGTSRAEVIAEFGSPLVSVLTLTQETLLFNGGVMITLKNGLVVH